MTHDEVEAKRAGFDLLLTKPVDIKELARAIDRTERAKAVAADVVNFKRV
jgi:DNA-binding response OmpR family regulator